jgi:hypothetical protein
VSRIECPDDLPPPVDFDAPARQADIDNDAAAVGYSRRFVHVPVTLDQIHRAIFLDAPLVACGCQVDPLKPITETSK